MANERVTGAVADQIIKVSKTMLENFVVRFRNSYARDVFLSVQSPRWGNYRPEPTKVVGSLLAAGFSYLPRGIFVVKRAPDIVAEMLD